MNDLLQAFTALTGLLLICGFMWSPQINLIVTVWAETRHVRTQTEIHFIAPAYSYTNNYACSPPPLANVDWSASLNGFCRPYKSTTGEMVPKEGSRLTEGTWYGSHCQCTSVYAL